MVPGTTMQGLAVRLDTRDIDAARDRLARSYCPHGLTPRGGLAGAAGFHARHTEGGGPDLAVFTLTYGSGPVGVSPVPFGDFVLVSRPLAGRLTVRSGGDDIVVGPGEAVALDHRSVHRLEFGPGCRLLTVKLPCSVIDRVAAATGRPATVATGTAADPRAWDAVSRSWCAR